MSSEQLMTEICSSPAFKRPDRNLKEEDVNIILFNYVYFKLQTIINFLMIMMINTLNIVEFIFLMKKFYSNEDKFADSRMRHIEF